MRTRHTVRSFSAYAGIYNLVDWYYESRGRSNRYANDIVNATSGTNGFPDMEEAKRRSPYFMRTPIENRRNKIGRAHVRTPVTNAHLVCRLLLDKKKK